MVGQRGGFSWDGSHQKPKTQTPQNNALETYYGPQDYTKEEIISEFNQYIEKTQDSQLLLYNNDENYLLSIPYTTRYSPQYRKKIFSKFHRLAQSYSKKVMIHINFGLSSKRMDHVQAIKEIRPFFNKFQASLRSYLRRYYIKINGTDKGFTFPDYVCVAEPHESGFPHLHVLYLSPFPFKKKDLDRLWSKATSGKADFVGNYNYVSSQRGLSSLPYYVAKYVGKQQVNPLFSALVWKFHKSFRSFTCSQKISKFIKVEKPESTVSWSYLGVFDVSTLQWVLHGKEINYNGPGEYQNFPLDSLDLLDDINGGWRNCT